MCRKWVQFGSSNKDRGQGLLFAMPKYDPGLATAAVTGTGRATCAPWQPTRISVAALLGFFACNEASGHLRIRRLVHSLCLCGGRRRLIPGDVSRFQPNDGDWVHCLVHACVKGICCDDFQETHFQQGAIRLRGHWFAIMFEIVPSCSGNKCVARHQAGPQARPRRSQSTD